MHDDSPAAHTGLPIRVNGAPRTVPQGCDLEGLLGLLGHGPGTVAVAVNGQFVPRSQRPRYRLRPGDAVQLVQPITGG